MELDWEKLTLHWYHAENSFSSFVSGHIDLKLYYKDLIKYKNSIYSFIIKFGCSSIESSVHIIFLAFHSTSSLSKVTSVYLCT